MLPNYEMNDIPTDIKRLSYAEFEQLRAVPDRPGLTTAATDTLYYLPKPASETVTGGITKAITDIGEYAVETGSFAEIELIDEMHRDGSALEDYFIQYEDIEVDKYFDMMSKVNFLKRVGLVLDTVSRAGETEVDSRYDFINDILRQYLAANPTVDFNEQAPHSLQSVEGFMGFYAQQVEKILVEQDWPNKIDGWRADFVQALNTPKLRQFIPKNARERGSVTALTIPVSVVDPLQALMNKKAEEFDLFGSFTPSDRTIAIDPFTISNNVERPYKRGGQLVPPEVIEVRVKETLFHELVHSVTDMYYRRYEYDDELPDSETPDTSINVMALWPAYWAEGITEKLSCLLLSEQINVGSIPSTSRPGHDGEADWREGISLSPRELGSTQKMVELRTKLPSVYREYRLLIDAMYAKLDWKAAGLTWRQAEQLAFKAFTEVPASEDEKPTNHHRKSFINAVNQASHPGFFMKFNNLVKRFGPELATDMLTDPDFDPHEPTSVPWLTGDVDADVMLSRDWDGLIKKSHARTEWMKAMKGPEQIIEQGRALEQSLEHRRTRSQVLKLASIALRRVLEQRHPARKGPNSQESLVMRSIFGEKVIMELVQRPQTDLKDEYEAIENWKSLNRLTT